MNECPVILPTIPRKVYTPCVPFEGTEDGRSMKSRDTGQVTPRTYEYSFKVFEQRGIFRATTLTISLGFSSSRRTSFPMSRDWEHVIRTLLLDGQMGQCW